MMALHFASAQAREEGVSDLDLYYLDKAAEASVDQSLNNKYRDGSLRYLFETLWRYSSSADPMGNYKQAVYKRLRQVEEQDSGRLIESVKKPADLLVYYAYLFEYKYNTVEETPISERVTKITQHLDEIAKTNSFIAEIIANNGNIGDRSYFFVYADSNTGKKYYIPQNIGGFFPFKEPVLKQFEKSEDLREYNSGFISWMKHFVSRLRQEKAAKGERNLIYLGLYGVSSSGKSTIVEQLVEALKEEYGEDKVASDSSDAYLHPRDLRKRDKMTIIRGQASYDLHAFERNLASLKDGQPIWTRIDIHGRNAKQKAYQKVDGSQVEIVVLDITAFGLDSHVAKHIDILVPILFRNDIVRLKRRLLRDPIERKMSVDEIIGDMVEKQFQELYGAMSEFVIRFSNEKAKGVIWLQDENRLVRLDKKRIGQVFGQRKQAPKRSELRVTKKPSVDVSKTASPEISKRVEALIPPVEQQPVLAEKKLTAPKAELEVIKSQARLGAALDSKQKQKEEILLSQFTGALSKTPLQEQFDRIDSVLYQAMDRAGLTRAVPVVGDEVRFYVAELHKGFTANDINELLKTVPANIHIAFVGNSAQISEMQSLISNERLHFGVDRGSLIEELSQRYHIDRNGVAHIATEGVVFHNEAVYRALLRRAWVPVLGGKLRIIEFTEAGLKAPSKAIEITLADLIEGFSVQQAATEARSRAA